MLEIVDVIPGSIADELDLKPGDRLVAIDGEPVRDIIDCLLADQRELLQLDVQHQDGREEEIELEKDAEEPLGLILPHPEPEQCGNNCIFCFVHQLPRGLRRTLYVKDEDYRFSYLYGAYVTLSNISEAALRRIVDQQLSPLYVSVHATDEEVRARLLGRRSPDIVAILRRLVDAGIKLHTQIVVCPGINDGEVLEKTFAELLALADGVESLAIVPVGLTGHRDRLPALRPLSSDEASTVVDWVHLRQQECLAALGRRFIFAADELYLLAGLELPGLESYENLPQVENGVGLIAQFRHQAEEVLSRARSLELPSLSLVTGRSAADEITRFTEALAEKVGAKLDCLVLENRFFGGFVTVTGLLTGKDLLDQLAGRPLGEVLVLPDVLMRDGEALLLDDCTVYDLEQRLGVRVEIIPPDPWGLWDLLLMLAEEKSVH